MRTQLQRLSIVSLVAVGTVFMAEPDLALARGCGGGNGGGEGHHADPQGGEGHHGPRNRGQRGRNGPNGGYRNGPHGRGPHGRPGRSGYPRVHRGPNVDVTVGGYGYPGGRIGPQTPACYELARMRNDLSALWNLRAQINSGKRLIVVDDGGQQRVISTRGHSRGATGHAVGGDRSVSGSAYGLSHDLNAAADLRDTSLVFVDQRISATQQRIGELEYDCQD